MINNLTKLPGGVGDTTGTDKVDPAQLSIGVQIEMEHTNDPAIAKDIAMDHLTEDPKYYTKLVDAGLAKEFQPETNSGFGDPTTGINDPSRTGNDGLKKGNMHGKMGETPNGQVTGRRSEPIINKTIDIELDEKKGKKKPKPTNPALWARAKAAARAKFDVYPSAYANGWAARWYKSKGGGWRMSEAYPAQAMDSPFPSSASPEGTGTGGSGYDFVGYAENKQTTMKDKLKEAIRKIILEAEDEVGVEADKETVTITLDKDLAQKLHDLLMAQLQPEPEQIQTPAGPEDVNAQGDAQDAAQDEAPTMSDDQLPPDQLDEVLGVPGTHVPGTMNEKKKWIQQAIAKKGALHKQLHVGKDKNIPLDKLKSAAKQGGKLGQRARLALTLRKLKKK
jgi:hypothetical protein